MELEKFATALIDKIKNKNSREWEIYASESSSAHIAWSDHALEMKQFATDGGFGIRLIDRGRQGFASCNTLDVDVLDDIWEKAHDMLFCMPEDTYRRIPEPQKLVHEELELFDPMVARMDLTGTEDKLAAMEKKLLAYDKRIKKAFRIEWEQGVGGSVLCNSKGVFLSRAGTACSAGVECIAEDKGDTQVGSFSRSTRFLKDLVWEDLPHVAGQLAIDQLSGSPIPSGELPIILEPWVVMDFLSMIAHAVCADTVQEGKSLFKDKINQTVASSLVSIIDDPKLKRGFGSSSFDDEGLPTKTMQLIERGVLKTYLYDTYTAAKDNTVSTGSARRPSFRGVPEPGTSTIIMHAGNSKRPQVIQEIDRGVRVISLLGMHTADPISGDFSVGAVGTLIEKGVYTRAVRGITIAGNVMDILKRIDAVCDDVMFLGSMGCPTIRVSTVMIGGT